jgi:hypothetical protein
MTIAFVRSNFDISTLKHVTEISQFQHVTEISQFQLFLDPLDVAEGEN